MNITLKGMEIHEVQGASRDHKIVYLYADSDYGPFWTNMGYLGHEFHYSEEMKDIRDHYYMDTLKHMLKYLLKKKVIDNDRANLSG